MTSFHVNQGQHLEYGGPTVSSGILSSNMASKSSTISLGTLTEGFASARGTFGICEKTRELG
jgi:hypothetical protein